MPCIMCLKMWVHIARIIWQNVGNILIKLQQQIRINVRILLLPSTPFTNTYSASSLLLVPSWLTLQNAAPIGSLGLWLLAGFNQWETPAREHVWGICSLLALCLGTKSPDRAAFLCDSSSLWAPWILFFYVLLQPYGCQWFLLLLVSECQPFFVSWTLPTSLSRSFHKILFKKSGEYSVLFWDSGLHSERVIDKLKDYKHFGLYKTTKFIFKPSSIFFFFWGQNLSAGMSANSYF